MRIITQFGNLLLALGLLAATAPLSPVNAAEPEGGVAEEVDGAEKQKRESKLKGSVVSTTASEITILTLAKEGAEAEQRNLAVSPEAVVKKGKDVIEISDLAAGTEVALKLDESGTVVWIRASEPKKEKAPKDDAAE